MYDANRDLLVLSKGAQSDPAELERQVSFLNRLLYHSETWEIFCTANEILDINRHRIIQEPHLIQNILGEKKLKAFVFTCNKN
jgi:hypothetical protein